MSQMLQMNFQALTYSFNSLFRLFMAGNMMQQELGSMVRVLAVFKSAQLILRKLRRWFRGAFGLARPPPRQGEPLTLGDMSNIWDDQRLGAGRMSWLASLMWAALAYGACR